jgi:hypothetical protein
MTDREERAFRSAFGVMDGHVPEAPGWDQISAPQARLREDAAGKPGRPMLIALAAAAIVLVSIGVPAILLFGRDGDDAGGRSPATTAPAATTEVPETYPLLGSAPLPDLAGPQLSWRAVTSPPAIERLDQVWAAPTGALYAYGDGELWTSSDGETWELLGDVPGSPNLGAKPSSPALVSFEGGFIALDPSGPGEEVVGMPPQLQISGDGREWATVDLPVAERASAPNLLFTTLPEAVAGGPQGVVVVGRAHPSVDPTAIERAFPDLGTVWDTDRLAPCCDDGSPYTTDIEDPLWVWTVESEEPAAVSLAELGLTVDDLWNRPSVMWWSDDGWTFSEMQPPFEVDGITLLTIPDGWMLVGEAASELWVSADGREWFLQSQLQALGFGWTVWGSGVAALDERTVLTLDLQVPADGSAPEVTGTGALPVPEPAEMIVESIAAGGLGLVVIGSDEQVLPDSGGEPIPFARVLWYSADGVEWSVQALGEIFGAAGSVQVAVTGDRVVVAHAAEQPHAGRLPEIHDPAWWVGIRGD